MITQHRGPGIQLDENWTMHLNKMDDVSWAATYVHDDGTYFCARFINVADSPTPESKLAAAHLFRKVKDLMRENDE